MQEPKNQDPEAWARYNEHCATVAARALGLPEPSLEVDCATVVARALGLPEPQLRAEHYVIKVESSGPLNDLLWSVRNAASELEGQGEKSDRIAQQLITALAKFAKETDMP